MNIYIFIYFIHLFGLVKSTSKDFEEEEISSEYRDIYCVYIVIIPPPFFEIQFFSPTNKFAAAQKDAFLRPFSLF